MTNINKEQYRYGFTPLESSPIESCRNGINRAFLIGFTQVELLIAVVVISVAIIAFVSAFLLIGRNIMTSKTRSIATTLAQEKMESLKNYSYYRLLPTPQADIDNYGYDNTYYPPEVETIAGIRFETRVLVEKVKEGTDKSILSVPPTA